MKRLFALMGLLALTCTPLSPAHAASLRISPIGADIPSGERATSFTLVNTAAEPVNLQLRVYKWSQANSEEILDPTNEMVVSPPATTIPAGASYTIRVARPSATPVTNELSYRLFIDELPKPVDPRTINQGISMVLRTSLPIFVVDKNAMAQLSWRVWQDADGLHAEATNSGRRHAKISGLSIQPTGGQAISFGQGLNGYVLAGARQRFDLHPAEGQKAPQTLANGTAVTLTAMNGNLEIQESLHAGTP